jgi:hypothetical protein
VISESTGCDIKSSTSSDEDGGFLLEENNSLRTHDAAAGLFATSDAMMRSAVDGSEISTASANAYRQRGKPVIDAAVSHLTCSRKSAFIA